MNTYVSKLSRIVGIGAVGLVVAAAAVIPSSAAAKPASPTARAAAATCADVPYRDRTQAPQNRAGVIFVPLGDVFRIWDNQRDQQRVTVWFNYAGVDDAWKRVRSPSDGGQEDVTRNVSERYKYICFQVTTNQGSSPIVRYRTRP